MSENRTYPLSAGTRKGLRDASVRTARITATRHPGTDAWRPPCTSQPIPHDHAYTSASGNRNPRTSTLFTSESVSECNPDKVAQTCRSLCLNFGSSSLTRQNNPTMKVFTVDELNQMGLEATFGLERTTVKGEGAQEVYQRIKAEVFEMQASGGTPEPAQP